MKVIALDFDGVLNSIESSIAHHHLKKFDSALYCDTEGLDFVSIGLLKCLCDITGAQIVVSSTWRLAYSITEFKDIFAKYGWVDAPIIDKTGRGGINTIRGDEIQDWLNAHPEVDNYVIIDDDSDMLESQLTHFVQTSGICGFGLEELCHALHIFGQPNADFEAHAFFKKVKPY